MAKATTSTAAAPVKALVATTTANTATTTPSKNEATTTPAASKAPVSTITTQTLPYSIGTFGNGFADGDGWIASVGKISQSDGALTLISSGASTAGGTMLSGSTAWSDYTFQANVDWLKGEAFALVARYVDSNNYIVCTFDEFYLGDVHMSIHQHVGGKVMDLTDGNILNYNRQGGTNLSVALEVQGSQAACGFDGHAISTIIAGNSLVAPFNGEIGFTTWDAKPNNTEIVVKNIGVVTGAYTLGMYDTTQ